METQTRNNFNHIHTLTIQGQIINAINEAFAKSTVTKWMKEIEKLAPPLYKSVRKALQQRLPTASNLVRSGKSKDPLCPLCQQIQSNKHIMSHCNSTFSLKRYKERHDKILIILADWILQQCKAERKIFVDLDGGNFNPLSELFQSLRPDIAVLGPNNDIEVLELTIVLGPNNDIEVLELTICHETNCNKSRHYKQSRYMNLRENLKTEYSNYSVVVHTIEITCLGLVSDCSQFCSNCLETTLPDQIKNQIIRSVISSSFLIYCNRNKNSD